MDAYVSGASADLFDIPAAEQEITVGSNEQSVIPSGLTSSGILGNAVASNSNAITVGTSGGLTLHNMTQGPRPTRVIMLQRSGQPGGVNTTNASGQRPGIKTVKIITVPGQGAGGKPIKAAVIPMHMLQRTVNVLPTGGQQVMVSGGPNTNPSMPRVLTIRPHGQMTSGHTIISGANTVTPIRPGTFIITSSAGGQITGANVNYQNTEDVENQMILGAATDMMNASQHGFIAAPGGYYDINTANAVAAGLEHPASPSGRESGDEQEQVATGLKTNGLRRYARCVCNKVKEKGITSYSEVADELVHEYAAEHPMIPSEQLHYIQKNIRRRVYDALNVLMALNVLQKEKKEIRWVGLPVNMIEECRRLEEEREKRQISLRNKTIEIQDLILQLIAFKNLVMRNRINDRYRQTQSATETQVGDGLLTSGPNGAGSTDRSSLDGLVGPNGKNRNEKIPLPFLVISTHRKTVIDCNISADKLEYLFNFDQAYEIRDEVDTLKRMGLMLRLGTIHCTQEEYNQCLELVPPSLRFYVEAIYERRQAIVPDFEALHHQRRLFVEARLASATANQAGGQGDDNEDSMVSNGAGDAPGSVHHQLDHHSLRNSRHSPLDSGGHYGNLFETSGGTDNGVRHLYLSRSDAEDGVRIGGGAGPISTSGFIPGDTQHYARAAASRGYVVPGGPGGLLRHRQHPTTAAGMSNIARQYGSTAVGNSSIARALLGNVEEAPDDIEGTSGPVGTEHPLSHSDGTADDLVDPDEEMMGEHGDDEDEDEDDDDMEEV